MTAATAETFEGIDRSLLGAVDKRFAALLALSMATHFAFAAYLSSQPVPVADDALELPAAPQRAALVHIPLPKEPGEVKAAKPSTAAPSAPKRGAAPAAAPRPAGLVAIIGAAEKEGGAWADLTADEGAKNLDAAMQGAFKPQAARAGLDLPATMDKGGRAEQIGPLKTRGAGGVTLGENGAKAPKQTPTLVFEPPPVKGDLAGLPKFVDARKKSLQHCYERELNRHPQLKGRVLIHLTLDGPGRAAEVDVDDETLGNEAVTSCVKTIVSAWVFPFQAHISVDLPFVFDHATTPN
jgi:hypothetical protein